MKKTFLFCLLSILSFSIIVAQEAPLSQWSHNHPKASEELGSWVRQHPQAAHSLFEWDGQHPEKSQELVSWCIGHPRENLQLFIRQHPDWKGLDIFAERHGKAMEEFMFWCSNHADAARALMSHSRGLQWAGDHLYTEQMKMSTPR